MKEENTEDTIECLDSYNHEVYSECYNISHSAACCLDANKSLVNYYLSVELFRAWWDRKKEQTEIMYKAISIVRKSAFICLMKQIERSEAFGSLMASNKHGLIYLLKFINTTFFTGSEDWVKEWPSRYLSELIKDQQDKLDFIYKTRIDFGGTKLLNGNSNAIKEIHALTLNQAKYLNAIDNSDVIFGVGPAGAGKTYLALAKAVSLCLEGRYENIVIFRPTKVAGDDLGYLPGDLDEKVAPFTYLSYDILCDILGPFKAMLVTNGEEDEEEEGKKGKTLKAPFFVYNEVLGYQRGVTLKNDVVILDEAQNVTCDQMLLFLTRFGEGCKYIINGDLMQSDLGKGKRNGLAEALEVFEKTRVSDICRVDFEVGDIVRSGIVQDVISAYDTYRREKE